MIKHKVFVDTGIKNSRPLLQVLFVERFFKHFNHKTARMRFICTARYENVLSVFRWNFGYRILTGIRIPQMYDKAEYRMLIGGCTR